MARDWPHPLDPEPSPTARWWQLVERMVLVTLLIAALVAALTGCGAAPVNDAVFTINASDVQGVWPLSIEAPVIANCGDGKRTIFIEANGKAYPLNQRARNRPESYTGRLAVALNEAALFKADPELQQYGNLHYPTSSVLDVAIQRCRQVGLSEL